MAGRTAIDLVAKLCYNLRILGTEIKGVIILFVDNQSMITNSTLPHYLMKERPCAINYHCVCGAVATATDSTVF